MAEQSRRLFLALWLAPALAERLHQLAGEAHRECGGRIMRQETLHLTLAFIGAVVEDRLPELLMVLGRVRVPRFHIRLDTVGHWAHNHILWAGCTEVPPALLQLAADIRREVAAIGLPVSGPAFVPHMTVLRKARTPYVPAVFEPLEWDVAEWALMESCLAPHGADYQRVAAWALD